MTIYNKIVTRSSSRDGIANVNCF